jgi:ferredoxin
MKTKIFYFTGTGNTLKIAKDIADSLGETELEPINKSIDNPLSLEDYDRVGLMFPVYMGGPPLIVKRFASQIKTDKYLFAVCTMGGNKGASLDIIRKSFPKGTILNSAFSVKMPSNYTPFGGAKEKKELDKIFKDAKKKTTLIVESIIHGNDDFETSSIFSFIFNTIIYSISSGFIPRMDKSFYATSICNGCETCKNICPVSNIKIENKKPVWQGRCEQCFSCIQWCPMQAIEKGKSTIGKKRYQNPNIKIKELMN